MFADVTAARALRAELESSEPSDLADFYRRINLTCPIEGCQRYLRSHRDNLPCQRRNEFDRYGMQH